MVNSRESSGDLITGYLGNVGLVGWVDVVDVRELVLFSDARRC